MFRRGGGSDNILRDGTSLPPSFSSRVPRPSIEYSTVHRGDAATTPTLWLLPYRDSRPTCIVIAHFWCLWCLERVVGDNAELELELELELESESLHKESEFFPDCSSCSYKRIRPRFLFELIPCKKG